jgi:leader peptidase (prepilin peptidase) / N-methyltransferase
MEWLLAFYAFLFGAIIGSFLNVVIHRYPREESIVFPPSRCTSCGNRIRPWDNIPIISWIILFGRCRSCREPIAIRYPLVEAANGLFYAAAYLYAGISVTLLLMAIIISMLICLIFIDLDHQILPDVIDKPGIVAGLFVGAFELGHYNPHLGLSYSLLDSILGAAAGYLLLWTVARLYMAWRGIEGMGQGDFKMLAMLGAVHGWQAVLPILFLASISGAIIGIGMALAQRNNLRIPLPFGVFLGIASFTFLFFGPTLEEWWLSLLVAP